MITPAPYPTEPGEVVGFRVILGALVAGLNGGDRPSIAGRFELRREAVQLAASSRRVLAMLPNVAAIPPATLGQRHQDYRPAPLNAEVLSIRLRRMSDMPACAQTASSTPVLPDAVQLLRVVPRR